MSSKSKNNNKTANTKNNATNINDKSSGVTKTQNKKSAGSTSEPLNNFLSFIRGIESQYRMAVAEEQETDDITQDIMHSLELEEHTYHEYAQLSKELAQVRKERRMAKDTIAVLKPVLDWADKNTTVIRELEALLGAVRKSEQKLNNRLYTSKTNNVALFAAKTSGAKNIPKGNVASNNQKGA